MNKASIKFVGQICSKGYGFYIGEDTLESVLQEALGTDTEFCGTLNLTIEKTDDDGLEVIVE